MAIRYDENTKARAVRLVREHRNDYGSVSAAMRAIAGRLGMSAETLRKWVRQAEVDAGEAAGTSSALMPHCCPALVGGARNLVFHRSRWNQFGSHTSCSTNCRSSVLDAAPTISCSVTAPICRVQSPMADGSPEQ